MGDAGYFRGTSAEQDNRFSDKEKKLMKQMKFADSLSTKVDMSKVKLDVMKPWITKRISELLGMEDDVLVEFVSNQLEVDNFPDGRRIQINLTGFLNGKNARIFTGELWDLLVSAQEQTSGIPTAIIESKKEEIKLRQELQEKTLKEVQRSVGKFQDKLLQDIKEERESPPPTSMGRNTFVPDEVNSSSRQPASHSNYSSSRDNDRIKEERRDRRPADRSQDRHPTRQYRPRRTHSRSRSPPIHHPKPRDGSRERDRDRADRDRGVERDRRDRPRGVDLMDEIRGERERERRRPSPQRPRRHSPPPPAPRSRSGQGRFETSEIRRALPPAFNDRAEVSRPRRRPSPSPSPEPTSKNPPESSPSSKSESEAENDEPRKRKKKSKKRSRQVSSASDSDSASPKPKKKKKAKKHKKHKKGKKSKVKEREPKVSTDEGSSSQEDEGLQRPEVLELIVSRKGNREELEKSLRERALQSMMRRGSSSKD